MPPWVIPLLRAVGELAGFVIDVIEVHQQKGVDAAHTMAMQGEREFALLRSRLRGEKLAWRAAHDAEAEAFPRRPAEPPKP